MDFPHHPLSRFLRRLKPSKQKKSAPHQPIRELRDSEIAALTALEMLDAFTKNKLREQELAMRTAARLEARRKVLLQQYTTMWNQLQNLLALYPERAWHKFCPTAASIPSICCPEELSESFPSESFGDGKVPAFEKEVQKISTLYGSLRKEAKKSRAEMRKIKYNPTGFD